MHLFLAAIPIVGLVLAMTVRLPRLRLPLRAHVALPAAAAAALAVQAITAGGGAALLSARIIEGLLTSLLPLSIVFGAIVLFQTLRVSGALESLTLWLARSAPDPVMRVVLIAWSFSYLVEGLSGFGTPAALAAPLLVGMGFPAIRAAAACLVMNTVPVVFGAVGMPIWFGLEPTGLSDESFADLRIDAAMLQCAVAPVIVAFGLSLLFAWRDLARRWLPIGVVVVFTVGSSAAVALVSTEFPSIVGGAVGLAVAFVVGRWVGRTPGAGGESADRPAARVSIRRAVFPLVLAVALLAATRIEALGLKALLSAESPSASLDLGPLGAVSVSAALVARVDSILGTPVSWAMPVLYVPFIVPFLVVSLVSAPVLGVPAARLAGVWVASARGLLLPAVALAGALVFVKLMAHGDDAAPVIVVGRALADAVGAIHEPLWLVGSPLVGALGSFFSGSATISNLTFGVVQSEVAEGLGLSRTRVLALQSIGAALGNMACLHNIVAVSAVLGLATHSPSSVQKIGAERPGSASPDDPVSSILRLTLPALLAAVLAAVAAAAVLPVAQASG